MKNITFFFLVYLLISLSEALGQIDDPFAESITNTETLSKNDLDNFSDNLDIFLVDHIEEGLINYKAAQSHKSALDKLVIEIENMELKELSQMEKLVFLVNAYNLLVIKSIADNYPTTSTQNVPGFFDKIKHTVAGKKMTLDELEKNKILKLGNNPLLHFVLVCGAKGCPPISQKAYRLEGFEKQMIEQTKLALDNKDFLYKDENAKRVHLSPIFDWYQYDFKPRLIPFINKYRTEKIPENWIIEYYEYDWKLNEFKTFLEKENNEVVSDIGVSKLYEKIKNKEKVHILDARTKSEYDIGHIEGAKRIGFDDFSVEKVWMIDHSSEVIVYSTTGKRSKQVGGYLQEMGFENVFNMEGVIGWINQGYSLTDRSGKKTKNVHIRKKENLKNLKKGKGIY